MKKKFTYVIGDITLPWWLSFPSENNEKKDHNSANKIVFFTQKKKNKK